MATIRLAILRCGTLPTQAKEKYTSYYALFRNLLERAASRLNPSPIIVTSEFDPREGPNYPVLDDVDAILITGSSYSSFGPEPWIAEVAEFVKKVLDQDRVRLIGVCFGHQITARAIEGIQVVGRNKNGWELGVTNIDLTERGKEVFEREELAMQQIHRDEVLYPPRGVEILGGTPKCAIQSMYIPGRLFTVQGHPEISEDIISELLVGRYEEGIISEEEYKEASEKDDYKHHGEEVGDLFLKFLTQ